MAITREAPGLFLRRATGLVKGWSAFDGFIYSVMSTNLIVLGLFGALSVAPFIPQGALLPAIITTALLVTFLVVMYASLVTVMPRAGGDYLWQSRILGGGPAFVLAVTGWWFVIWHWTPIYGNILAVEVFQPLWAVLELKIGPIDAAWFTTSTGLFVVTLIAIALATLFVALGMSGYARVQKFSFYVGMVGFVVVVIILLFGSRSGFENAFNREAAALFGSEGNAYQQTITRAVVDNETATQRFGLSPFFGGSLLLVPFMAFYLLWPNWGATLYGEVRGASDFRRVLSSMVGGLWVTVIMSVVLLALVAKTIGWDFYNAANTNYWFSLYGSEVAPTMPVWPYPVLLASFYLESTALQVLLILAMGMWFIGGIGPVFLSSTRVIFAAAFDRVLPEWAASVSEKRHVPYGALALMFLPSIIVSWIYAYDDEFVQYTLGAVLVIATAFLGTAIAAAILPWRKKGLYEASPIGRHRVAGVPLITIAAVVTAAFIGWLLYQWLTNDTYGVNNTRSLLYLASLYGLAAAVYVVAFVIRKREGLDLRIVHREIPVE